MPLRIQGMRSAPVIQHRTVKESAALLSARRLVADAVSELETAWTNPHPDALVAAAKRHLAAVENWADVRREGA